MDDYELAQKYETVNLYRRGGAAKIELNRPESRNAWNTQFSVDLLAALRTVGDDPGVRAVLITGAGKAFSSGADLRGPTKKDGRSRSARRPASGCSWSARDRRACRARTTCGGSGTTSRSAMPTPSRAA